MKRLLAAIPRTGLGLRDCALLLLVIDTGLRIEEALSLRPDNIDFSSHQICVRRGKRDKRRYVPFTSDLESILLRWLRGLPLSAEHLFCTMQGVRLTYWGAHEILYRVHLTAGLERFYSWHKFRHFSAQQYRRAGGDVFDLQKILGHGEITTTVNHYGNFASDELIEKHERLSAINVLRDDKGI